MYLFKLLKKVFKKIISLQDNIVTASGLSSSFLGEVVKFKTPGSELIGQILNLEKNLVSIVIVKGSYKKIQSSKHVYRINKTTVGLFKSYQGMLSLYLSNNNQKCYYHKNLFFLESNVSTINDCFKLNQSIIENNIKCIDYYYNNTFEKVKYKDFFFFSTDFASEENIFYYRNIPVKVFSSYWEYEYMDQDKKVHLNFVDLCKIDYEYHYPVHLELYNMLNLKKDSNKFEFIYVNLKTFEKNDCNVRDFIKCNTLITEKELNLFIADLVCDFDVYFYNLHKTEVRILKQFLEEDTYVISEYLICLDKKNSAVFQEQLNFFKQTKNFEMSIEIHENEKYFYERQYFRNNNWDKYHLTNIGNVFFSFKYDSYLNDYYYLGYHSNLVDYIPTDMFFIFVNDYVCSLKQDYDFNETTYSIFESREKNKYSSENEKYFLDTFFYTLDNNILNLIKKQ